LCCKQKAPKAAKTVNFLTFLASLAPAVPVIRGIVKKQTARTNCAGRSAWLAQLFERQAVRN
jgi:hypothetical protein